MKKLIRISVSIFLFFPVLLQAQETGQYFTAPDSVKIYYEVTGKGEPVILVHGFIVNSDSWKKGALYKDLQKAGFQVIILDQRGNGKSDKPHDPVKYENDTEAKDIMQLASLLKLRSYNVVGYSRGSIITSRLLVLDKRVKKAVLGGMGADFTDPNWQRRLLFYRALMGEDVPELAGMVKYVKESGLDTLALAYMQKSQPSTVKEEFAKVEQSVLVISGEQDNDNGKAEDLAALIKNSTVKRVPGVHNDTHRSQVFADEVIGFLRK